MTIFIIYRGVFRILHGGGEIKKSILTSCGAHFYLAKCGIVFSRALFRPPINIIRINTFGKTHIKKVVGPVV